MLLYNSLFGKKEEFLPNTTGKVNLYTCGPTVYNYAHIGNLRSYIMEDILEKTLTYMGYEVNRCMNITDVGHLSSDADSGEDKMLKGAERENKSVLEIARFYTEAFKKDFEKLNLKWPKYVVPASSCIDVYIEIIKKLLEKGYAYESNGNIYFDISKLENYNVFFKQETDDMIVGARENVSEDLGKKNNQDFVLWFTKSKFENHALKWDSPWGVGYPGWHIECSGISYKYLGEYLDIHCGGVDNKFPHHTNEIAQSESFLGHKWCNYWFHVEHLNMKDGKMSKSSGNFLTLDKLINDGYSPEIYKFFCLQSHYRKELLFSKEGLDSAKNAYIKLLNKISLLDETIGNIDYNIVLEYKNKFKECLGNDLNTSSAITLLFDVLKENINDITKLEIIKDFDKVFCINLLSYRKEKEISEELEKYILEKIKERHQAKLDKNYSLADEIRNDLFSKGIILKDTREGTVFETNQEQILKKK